MIRCFGGGFRQDGLQDEVAWLKRMLEREKQQRQAAQAQLTQEQAKCALLEQEILQASQAAHEMGESLRQYFGQAAGSECSDATTATIQAWTTALTGSACESAAPSLAGDTPRAANMGYYTTTATKEPIPAGMQQPARHDTSAACDQAISINTAAPGHLPQHHSSKRSSSRLGTDQHHKAPPSLLQQHLQQRQGMHTPQQHDSARSSCSSNHAALRCSSQQSSAIEFSPLLTKQPALGRGSTARMQHHVLQVADQLKGLAVSWQQRLDNCEPLPCSSPTKPAMVTIGAAAAAAAAARGARSATMADPTRQVAAGGPTAAGATSRPAGCSGDWGSSSCQSSSATAMYATDASCDLSSSTSSFVRYRSNQAAYGESPADIAEGDEEGDDEDSEHLQGEGSDGYVCCETDEEAEAAQLRWHVQQLEQQQQQQPQERQLPSHSQLQQHAQQQVLAKHAQWQQQQQQVGLGSWAKPAHDKVMPGCAITRGAASCGAAAAPDSSSASMRQSTPGAAAGVAAGRSPPAAAAAGGKSLPPAPHMVPQQELPLQQQDLQHNMHGYNPTPGAWLQQHSSPFPSLSGTSFGGTSAVVQQQQHSLHTAGAAGAGVEHIPQELKFMAPLRRHQQYLGTT